MLQQGEGRAKTKGKEAKGAKGTQRKGQKEDQGRR